MFGAVPFDVDGFFTCDTCASRAPKLCGTVNIRHFLSREVKRGVSAMASDTPRVSDLGISFWKLSGDGAGGEGGLVAVDEISNMSEGYPNMVPLGYMVGVRAISPHRTRPRLPQTRALTAHFCVQNPWTGIRQGRHDAQAAREDHEVRHEGLAVRELWQLLLLRVRRPYPKGHPALPAGHEGAAARRARGVHLAAGGARARLGVGILVVEAPSLGRVLHAARRRQD